jgi:hypothetical protein
MHVALEENRMFINDSAPRRSVRVTTLTKWSMFCEELIFTKTSQVTVEARILNTP